MEDKIMDESLIEKQNGNFAKPMLCVVISRSEITQKLNKLKGRYFVYLLLHIVF